MPRKHLSRYDDAIAVLGGDGGVADLTGVSRSTVTGWRRSGLFPAQHLRLIERELRAYDCDVPDSLFDFTGNRPHPPKTPRPRWSEALRKKILDSGRR